VLVTAGPTRESLDPIRFISNRSTGRMGYALAAEAAARGASVVLVSGPTPGLQVPPGNVERVPVETAEEMHAAVLGRAGGVDVVVKAAAVADWRPARVSPRKLKKGDGEPQLTLSPTQDILQALLASRKDGRPLLVGFAAETDDVQARAREKLTRKPVDLLVVNDVSDSQSGFGTETNRVTILTPEGDEEALPLLTKREVAARVFARVSALLEG
jgi:phosphopantothenoylcysteine decarboxylase/phosphopantothenate--cysteine ligase